MKTLIAVTTCHPFRDRADAVRQTWGAEVEGADIRYFLGKGEAQRPDEIILDCPDGYHYLSLKTQMIRRWALSNGYDYLWKIDDDCYVRPERLLADFQNLDYVGRLRGCSGGSPGPYCSGFTYGLSKKALELDLLQIRSTSRNSPPGCADLLIRQIHPSPDRTSVRKKLIVPVLESERSATNRSFDCIRNRVI